MKINTSPTELWIRDNTEKLIKLIQELVQIPSITGNVLAHKPYINKIFKGNDF